MSARPTRPASAVAAVRPQQRLLLQVLQPGAQTKAEGKKGDELIAAVKAKLAETKQPKAKPAPAKKRAASNAKPVTTEDALQANAELYGEAEGVPF